MDQDILCEKLDSGQVVYVLDDFYEVAIRLFWDGKKTNAFLKHKGSKEIEVPQSNKTFCDVVLGGDEITKEEYEKYSKL